MSSEEMVHKVTLSSGKVVLLKDFKIKHQRQAAQAAAGKSGDNINLLGVNMSEEILKLLIVKIGDAAPDRAKLEDLDNYFSYQEYGELQKVVGKLMGGDTPDPKVEAVSSGTL